MTAKLIFRFPDGGEKTVEMRPGEPFTLGRSHDNAICLNDCLVSRHHARLVCREDGACLIEDLQSANGTFLHGAPLARLEVLQDGDLLRFGDVTATYHATEANAARLPPIEPVIGQTFAHRFRLESSLGETSEYHNFLATDVASGSCPVSLKIFHPGVIAQAGGFDLAVRTYAGVRAAPSNVYLIGLREFGRWRGASYLVSEWAEGHPLLDLLRRRGALSSPDVLSLARQAAAATDHARVYDLPAPDLDLRATLLGFDLPLPLPDWERLLDEPVIGWPVFTLKVFPRLFDSPAVSPWPLGALLCELFGHPASTMDEGRTVRIASLGEVGNATLARGLASAGKEFGGDAAFVAALTQAAGVTSSAMT